MKRAFSVIAVLLLICSALSVSMIVLPNAYGSGINRGIKKEDHFYYIDHSGYLITKPGYYFIVKDLKSPSHGQYIIGIEASNVIINGEDHTLTITHGTGILFFYDRNHPMHNVTIENLIMRVDPQPSGRILTSSKDNSQEIVQGTALSAVSPYGGNDQNSVADSYDPGYYFTGFKVINCQFYFGIGMYFDHLADVLIEDTMFSCYLGGLIQYALNFTIVGTTFYTERAGIIIRASSQIVMKHSSVYVSKARGGITWGVLLLGDSNIEFLDNQFINSTTLPYVRKLKDLPKRVDIGLGLMGSNSIKVSDNIIEGYGVGLYLQRCKEVSIVQNTIYWNLLGIWINDKGYPIPLPIRMEGMKVGEGIVNSTSSGSNEQPIGSMYLNTFCGNRYEIAISYPSYYEAPPSKMDITPYSEPVWYEYKGNIYYGELGNYYSDYQPDKKSKSGIGSPPYDINAVILYMETSTCISYIETQKVGTDDYPLIDYGFNYKLVNEAGKTMIKVYSKYIGYFLTGIDFMNTYGVVAMKDGQYPVQVWAYVAGDRENLTKPAKGSHMWTLNVDMGFLKPGDSILFCAKFPDGSILKKEVTPKMIDSPDWLLQIGDFFKVISLGAPSENGWGYHYELVFKFPPSHTLELGGYGDVDLSFIGGIYGMNFPISFTIDFYSKGQVTAKFVASWSNNTTKKLGQNPEEELAQAAESAEESAMSVAEQTIKVTVSMTITGKFDIYNDTIVWKNTVVTVEVNGDYSIQYPIAGYTFKLTVMNKTYKITLGVDVVFEISPSFDMSFIFCPANKTLHEVLKGVDIALKKIIGEIDIPFTVTINGGIAIASLSGSGTLEFDMNLQNVKPYVKSFLIKGELQIQAQVLIWSKTLWSASGVIYRWPSNGNSNNGGGAGGWKYHFKIIPSTLSTNTKGWTVIPRYYNTTTYNLIVWNNTWKGGYVIENVYPYTHVSGDNNNGDIYLVYSYDDVHKSIFTGLSTGMLIYDSTTGKWVFLKVPRPLGTIALRPKVLNLGSGKLVIGFETVKSALLDNLSQMLTNSSMGLCLMEYNINNGSWKPIATLEEKVIGSYYLSTKSNGGIEVLMETQQSVFSNKADLILYDVAENKTTCLAQLNGSFVIEGFIASAHEAILKETNGTYWLFTYSSAPSFKLLVPPKGYHLVKAKFLDESRVLLLCENGSSTLIEIYKISGNALTLWKKIEKAPSGILDVEQMNYKGSTLYVMYSSTEVCLGIVNGDNITILWKGSDKGIKWAYSAIAGKTLEITYLARSGGNISRPILGLKFDKVSLVPPKPVNITAKAGASWVRISWSEVGGNYSVTPLEFVILRDGQKIAEIPGGFGNNIVYNDTSVFPSRQYTYQIEAIGPFGDIIKSAPLVVTTDEVSWSGQVPPKVNTMWISNGEVVVKDPIGDERTDFAKPDPRVDITEFRIAEDTQYYYFLVKFDNMSSFKIGDDGATFLVIAIGDGTNTGNAWLAGNCGVKVPYPVKYEIVVNLAASNYAGKGLTTVESGPVNNWGGIFYVVHTTSSSWTFVDPSGASMVANLTKGIIEVKIPRSLFSGSELNITVASARGWSNYADNQGGVKGKKEGKKGMPYPILDTVNATGLSGLNTWNDLKDGVINGYLTIKLIGIPSYVKAKEITPTSAYLYWEPIFRTPYKVEIATNESFAEGSIVDTIITYSNFTQIKGLSPLTKYYVRVSTDMGVTWSKVINFTTAPAPKPPSGFYVSDVDSNYVQVSWNGISGESYDLRICTKDNPNSWIQEQNAIQATTATFYDLKPDTLYYVFIRTNDTSAQITSSWESLEVYTTSFHINGNGSDWNIKIPEKPNTWTYEHGVLVWKDALNDERTDYNVNGHVPPDLDLDYFAMYSDGHYAYFLVKLKGLTKIGSYQSGRDWWSKYQGLGLIIGISNGSSRGMSWLPNYINAKYPFPVQRQLVIMLSNPGWDYNCKRIHGNYAEFTVYALNSKGDWVDVGSSLSIFVANATTGEIEIMVPMSDLGISSLNDVRVFVATGIYDWHSSRFLTFGGTGVMDAITFTPGNTWNEISQKIEGNFALHSYLVYNGRIETVQAWKALGGTSVDVIGTIYAKEPDGVFIEGEFLGKYYGAFVPCKPSKYRIGDKLEVKGAINWDSFGNLEIIPTSVEKMGKESVSYPEISIKEFLSVSEFTEEAAAIKNAYVEYIHYYRNNDTTFMILNCSGSSFEATYYGKNLAFTPGFSLEVYGVAKRNSNGISMVVSSYKMVQLPRPKISLIQKPSGILIKWSKVPYASYYIVEVSKELSFEHILYRANLTSTSWFIGGIPAGTYYARVKAFTSTGISSPWGVSFSLPPLKIVVVEVSSNSVEIKWQQDSLANYYEYQVSTCKSFSKVEVAGKTEYNYTILSNLKPYTKYYFRVRAANTTYGVFSSWTIVSFRTSKPMLNSPIVYGRAINQTAISVWWSPVPYADHYQVAWSTNKTLPPGPYLTVTGTSVNITGLSPATTYYVFVRAVSFKYNESSEWSSINVETKSPGSIATPSIQIVRVGTTWALIKLSREEGADHYVVEISKSRDFSGASVVASTSNLINVTGLSPYTKYYVRGYVVNETYGLKSNYSEVKSFVTLKPSMSTPRVTIIEIGATFVKVKISPIKYASGYEVEVFGPKGAVYDEVVHSTLVIVQGLFPNTTYLMKVRAISTAYQICSGWASVRFTTKKLIVEAPQLKSIKVGSTWVELSWYPVKYADEYRVEVSMYSDFCTVTFVQETKETSINITELSPDTVYYVGLSAYNSTYGVPSRMLIFKVTTATAVSLKAPSNLTASEIEIESATISWSPVKGALYYVVQISTSMNFTSAREIGTKATSIEIQGLSPNTTYYVRVKAAFLEGFSPWSYVLEFTTLREIKASAIQVYYSVLGGGRVRLYLGGSNLFYVQVRNFCGSILYTVPSSGNVTLYFYSPGNYTLYVYGYNGRSWVLKVISFEIKKPYTGPMTIGKEKVSQGPLYSIEKLLYRWLRALPRFWIQSGWTKVNYLPRHPSKIPPSISYFSLPACHNFSVCFGEEVSF